MINIFRKIIPDKIFVWLKRKKYAKILNPILSYNKKRILMYSSEMNLGKTSSIANLMIVSHVLQKGITMPNRRYGFAFDRVRDVVSRCNYIIKEWGADSVELQSALADLNQYYSIHKEADYTLPEDIELGIKDLLKYLNICDNNCFEINKESYFRKAADFFEFAQSRHSIRWYSDKHIDVNILKQAIKLAQTAPSACNRQSTRVKIISSEKGKKLCVNLQNGNRGFGEKADKWLLITTEMSAWSCTYPNAGYIDAGIFIMNLLYALHYYGIVACTLNAHLTPEQSEKLQKELGYSPSESPVAFITVGLPTDKFMVPKSRRVDIDTIIQEL